MPHNNYLQYRLQSIEILGTRYKPGGIVVLSVEEDYNFGLISDVIVFDVDDYYIVCEELNTNCFNSHLRAYEVSHDREPSFVFVKQFGLADHSVLGLYKKANTSFIVCKYRVLCL